MKSDSLFSQFDELSKEHWIKQIEKDLKGKPYNELIKNVNGINTEPVYTFYNSVNEAARGFKNTDNDWAIYQTIGLTNSSNNDNLAILNLLNKGLTGIILNGTPSKETLTNIAPQHISTAFENYNNLNDLIDTVKSAFGKVDNQFEIYLNFDPITAAAKKGIWDKKELKKGIEGIKQLTNYNRTRVFSINAAAYHNCGAGAISELGLALAQSHEYIVYMLENGLSIDDASAQLKINLAAGRDFFVELAKFRAFKILYAKLIEAYKPKHSCSKSCVIHTQTSFFHNTVYEPYTNILRATTQSMSAALGGVDGIEIIPFDAAWNRQNEFSSRVARNIQLLLKEESYFDKVIDPAAGSYYIEQLTNSLAKQAWVKFQKIEKKGGFLSLLTSGNLHRELKEEGNAQIEAFNKDETKVLGVNYYIDKTENAIDKLMVPNVDDLSQKREGDFPCIEIIRLTEIAEEKRLNKELEEKK